MARNKQTGEPPSISDSCGVRILRILGLFTRWYYHTLQTILTEISVAKVMTISFNLLAAEYDRLALGGNPDDVSGSAPSTLHRSLLRPKLQQSLIVRPKSSYQVAACYGSTIIPKTMQTNSEHARNSV